MLFCYPYQFIKKTRGDFSREGAAAEWPIWVPAKAMLGKFLQKEHTYGEAVCFHPRYNPHIDFAAIRSYLRSKHVVIITSNTERFSDLQLGLSTHFIDGPASDAWRFYTQLEARALALVREKGFSADEVLFMVSAAEAAKVMVYDLAKAGYTAWDTGQFFDLAAKEIAALDAR
jgi:hypothetical protein